jgi:hypothetical protein
LEYVVDPKFQGKLAVIASPVRADGRVQVIVVEMVGGGGKLGKAVRVRSVAVVAAVEPRERWWESWIVKGVTSPISTALINSKRVCDLLEANGLPLPVAVAVEPHPMAEPCLCHANVADLADEYGATPVFGYCLFPAGRCQCVAFEAHSLLRKKNGQLVDITPDWEGEHVKYFVEDVEFEAAQFTKMLYTHGNVQPSPVVTECGKPVLHCGCSWCNLEESTPPGMTAEEARRRSPKSVTRERASDLVALTKDMKVFVM